MAKKKELQPVSEVTQVVGPGGAGGEVVVQETAAPVVPAGPSRWQVQLSATTPLAYNPAYVDATDEAGAWAAFCTLNGISGSDHEKQITRVGAVASE